MQKSNIKTILVAPLNWGLGHATRCIPIINALLKYNYNVLIGSDGKALELLRLEFPKLPFITLPSYHIKYPKNGAHFKMSILAQASKIYSAIQKEKKIAKKLVAENRIQGIISDNRLGVRATSIPCVYITHQINVLSGNTTAISSAIHQKHINRFDVCWVPDYKGKPNLSGKLGHSTNFKKNISFIGPISRMKNYVTTKKYAILVILSGPEPQRDILEKLLLEKLENYSEKVFFIRGVVAKTKESHQINNITLVNYLTTKELKKVIHESELVICRSGYTSIMDLSALNKKAFLIPTPGQYEQEYLAKKLHLEKRVPSCSQEDFELSKLSLVADFSGWGTQKTEIDFKALFHIFEGK